MGGGGEGEQHRVLDEGPVGMGTKKRCSARVGGIIRPGYESYYAGLPLDGQGLRLSIPHLLQDSTNAQAHLASRHIFLSSSLGP